MFAQQNFLFAMVGVAEKAGLFVEQAIEMDDQLLQSLRQISRVLERHPVARKEHDSHEHGVDPKLMTIIRIAAFPHMRPAANRRTQRAFMAPTGILGADRAVALPPSLLEEEQRHVRQNDIVDGTELPLVGHPPEPSFEVIEHRTVARGAINLQQAKMADPAGPIPPRRI